MNAWRTQDVGKTYILGVHGGGPDSVAHKARPAAQPVHNTRNTIPHHAATHVQSRAVLLLALRLELLLLDLGLVLRLDAVLLLLLLAPLDQVHLLEHALALRLEA